MKIDYFDFELPDELIAQTPLDKRDESRLLVLDKKTGEIEHKKFYNIIDYIDKNDVLVINDSKVMPARLIGTKIDTGAVIELLLLKEISKNEWECLVKPAKKIKIGTELIFGNKLKVICTDKKEMGIATFRLDYKGVLYEILDELGEMPLPPYIHEKLKDKNRYQTVYAKNIGSAAAPTAGLHFTPELLQKLKDKGVKIVSITLHVGLGTFRPVSVTNIDNHVMHSEFFSISNEVAKILNETRLNNHKIIGVGTTTTRTLETIMRDYGKFIECSGFTDIFIKPGFKFQAIDMLITNFHLPKSTLVMLVSALAGRDNIMNAYHEAIKMQYRFFSFGDSMIIK